MPSENINRRGPLVAHEVRVTQEPTVVRKVTDSELLDLARQGLIHSLDLTEKAQAVIGKDFTARSAWAPRPATADPSTPVGQKGK